MPKPAKAKLPSFAALTAQVVNAAAHPLPFDEIMRRVEALRPIDTNSPKGTIRSAMSQCRLIAPDGSGNYGWSLRMMQGARLRVGLVAEDLAYQPARIEFDDDARELLWPAFFGSAKIHDKNPIELALPTDETTRLPLSFFGNGHWGTDGTPEFWAWLKQVKARAGDDVIFEAVDAEARRYAIAHVPASQRDDAAIQARTVEIIEASVCLLQHPTLGRSISAKWDLARLLLVMGHYTHPVPPKTISQMWPAMVRRAQGGELPGGEVLQLKITLEDAQPPIWRRVRVSNQWTLGALHYVIQVAMGWTNSHLHQFIFGEGAGRTFYSLYPDGSDELETRDAAAVKLSEVLPKVKAGCFYEYDFGDSWLHRIEVEEISPADPSQVYPACVDGRRASPPDDCGGVFGYENLLEIIRDPKHPEYEDMRMWLEELKGEDFDPERFDPVDVNRRLSLINPKQLAAERNVRLFAS